MDGNIITSIVESQKVREGDTLLVVDGDGRKRGLWTIFLCICVFFCFLQIMWDGMVMVIYGFNGTQCLELSSYSSFLMCVNGFCIVVWRIRIMECMKQTLYGFFNILGILKKP
jgi:hypothetical protein